MAIAADIAFVSPSTFPAVAGILSHLISLAPSEEKVRLWNKVRDKMARIPYNGYLEIWLQRVTRPEAIGIRFDSEERICKIVNGGSHQLWDSSWISNNALKQALDCSKIVISNADDADEVIQTKEIEFFRRDYLEYCM